MVSGVFNWVSNLPEASDRRMRLSVFVLIWMVAPSMGWRRESRRIPLMEWGDWAISRVLNSNMIMVIFCISVMVSGQQRNEGKLGVWGAVGMQGDYGKDLNY